MINPHTFISQPRAATPGFNLCQRKMEPDINVFVFSSTKLADLKNDWKDFLKTFLCNNMR